MMRADAAAAVACLRYTPRVTGMEQESGDEEGGGRVGWEEGRNREKEGWYNCARMCVAKGGERVGERSVWQCQRRQRQRR